MSRTVEQDNKVGEVRVATTLYFADRLTYAEFCEILKTVLVVRRVDPMCVRGHVPDCDCD